MPNYAILRFSKHKGAPAGALEAHHERTKEKYDSNPDIDTSKSKYNFHTIAPQGKYRQEIDSRIQTAGCRTRKDSTRFVDTLITASPEFFKGKKMPEVKAFFQQATDFLSQRVGKQNIISAVVHLDEKTPHLHLTFVPLTADNRLSAKEILGNRASLSRWQDDFFTYMVEHFPDLERGEPSRETGRRHIPMRVFKQAANLTKQAERIDAMLQDINRINAPQKRDEVAAALAKFFPAMEDFEGQLKKYKGTIQYLQNQNANLAETAEANRDNKLQSLLEINKWKSEAKRWQKMYNALPEDLRRELDEQQRLEKAQRRTRGR